MPDRKSDKKKDKAGKDELLEGLEHIHDSLSPEDVPTLTSDDIPVLTDSLNDNEEETPDVDALRDKFRSGSEDFYDEVLVFDDDGATLVDRQSRESSIQDPLMLDEPPVLEELPVLDEPVAEPILQDETVSHMPEDSTIEEIDDQEPVISPPDTIPDTQASQRPADALEGQGFLFDHAEGLTEEDLLDTKVRPAVQPEDYETSSKKHSDEGGENPFLPQHVRDKLKQGKSDFLEEFAQVSESLVKFGSIEEHVLDRIAEGGFNKDAADVAADAPAGLDAGDSAKTDLAKADVAEADAAKTSVPESQNTPACLSEDPRLQNMVDELVAIYLPKIEAQLRENLVELLKDEIASHK